jgi:hypothetical protein
MKSLPTMRLQEREADREVGHGLDQAVSEDQVERPRGPLPKDCRPGRLRAISGACPQASHSYSGVRLTHRWAKA